MPNNYFKFKQFTVLQDQCAMKVCTDACLFGAYVADLVKTKAANNILDIGTGTGLLSLMLAQRVAAAIEAVEIDSSTFIQANENFQQSPWKERLSVFNTDVLHFEPGKKYDCIISNPPFFENNLQSNNKLKNMAKHAGSLSFVQLLGFVKKNLKADGFFAVLLPYHRVDELIETAFKAELYINKKLLVSQSEKHGYFRGILIFSKQQTLLSEETMAIKNSDDKYSLRFAELLKDYYLYL